MDSISGAASKALTTGAIFIASGRVPNMVMTFNIVPPTYFVYFLYHESRHIQTFLNHFIKLFQLSLLYHVQAFHTSRNCKEVHQNKRSQPSPHRVSKH